jgi:isochorismate synthase
MEVKKTPLDSALEEHRSKDLPWVCFSLPHQNEVKLVLQSTQDLIYADDQSTGFMVAPFDNASQKPLLFRPDAQWDSMRSLLGDVTKPNQQMELSESDRKDHEARVEQALQAIDAHALTKVVLARTIDCEGAYDSWLIFRRMLHAYPAAMVAIWSHPRVGMWLCATPERLLRTSKQLMETVALAGTSSASSLEDVVWGEKEIQEQRWVTQDLDNSLRSLGLSPVIHPLQTVQAGPIFHLAQTINAEREGVDLETLISVLHPSPAIGGLPRAAALKMIKSLEKEDRAFYAGYLGWIDAGNQADLYVTLRCLSWKNDCVKLYVGGGIVAGSNPGLEWEETQAKARVLAQLIG